MLTDTALNNLKQNGYLYKVSDGMYVTVATSGSVTFRYDYRLHGGRETLTIGRDRCMTKTKQPPANLARFNRLGRAIARACRDGHIANPPERMGEPDVNPQ
jgi:hypothetical protein